MRQLAAVRAARTSVTFPGHPMGIYDRDYERSYDTGSGWRDSYGQPSGIKNWTANTKLLLVLLIVHLAQVIFQPYFTDIFRLPSDWLFSPWRTYGLVTYGLLHNPHMFWHLAFNCMALYFFGRSVEARYGSKEYLCLFFAAVIFAGLVWTIAELMYGGQPAALLGASGDLLYPALCSYSTTLMQKLVSSGCCLYLLG